MIRFFLRNRAPNGARELSFFDSNSILIDSCGFCFGMLQTMAIYLRPSITHFARTLKLSEQQLLELQDYRQCGTEIGQINLGLSLYKKPGGSDPSLIKLNQHFTNLLDEAFVQTNGGPISSYPQPVWPFDSIPAIVS